MRQTPSGWTSDWKSIGIWPSWWWMTSVAKNKNVWSKNGWSLRCVRPPVSDQGNFRGFWLGLSKLWECCWSGWLHLGSTTVCGVSGIVFWLIALALSSSSAPLNLFMLPIVFKLHSPTYIPPRSLFPRKKKDEEKKQGNIYKEFT